MLPPLLAWCWRHCVGLAIHPSILHLKSSWTRLLNCLGKSYQIYTICAAGDKDELVRFWAQNAKYQVHNQTKYGKKNGAGMCIDGSTWSSIELSCNSVEILMHGKLLKLQCKTSGLQSRKQRCPYWKTIQ